MTRCVRLEHRYVEFIPKDLDEGILYISKRFKTASHLCCCGCDQKVVTPLNQAQWTLTDHGSTVSLAPSIGLGTLPCRSHYWIRRSRVEWYPSMTVAQTARAQRADRYACQVYMGERLSPTPPVIPSTVHEQPSASSLWGEIKRWLRFFWK